MESKKQNILIVNGGKAFQMSGGKLSASLVELAEKILVEKGYPVKTTKCDKEYDIKAELELFKWADVVIWQVPVWWMQVPWTVKKYIDEVFFAGHGILYESDGRTRKDPTKLYGSGGLCQNKKFMVSSTWNAPYESLHEPGQFFNQRGPDEVLYPFRACMTFVGYQELPHIAFNDVAKNPHYEQYVKDYTEHLNKVFP
ncbi:Modulator of drug activity B, putative [Trichomonas vaginalis G3]|uniref:Modulator of drug activity B, putative n=1 Tax=Trichomonas vaginalis (strain ATCC PRA-98 / G3) TaxID=412133 RepID=A2EPW7_TRIV3|nr:flavodoxin-like fold [Trichomonas vaginalis G3]EAY05305.1 Modulator of drug activity B, putative [Trichomonas vaginalis G3]KAI5531862.1 flavodoxin-like fold [Trichomonas vaginalis G3]|eukprot:XP_001317528.1 Modulator of drug activity B [Trichomonas vaginalis G3]